MLYLDTSAFLKLYVLEEGSVLVQELVRSQSRPLPVWEIQKMELVNALRLKVFWKEISSGDADRQIALFEKRQKSGLYFFPELDRPGLMQRFEKLSRVTERSGCRTMDVLHVACALEIGAECFLTFDARQAALARDEGLQVQGA